MLLAVCNLSKKYLAPFSRYYHISRVGQKVVGMQSSNHRIDASVQVEMKQISPKCSCAPTPSKNRNMANELYCFCPGRRKSLLRHCCNLLFNPLSAPILNLTHKQWQQFCPPASTPLELHTHPTGKRQWHSQEYARGVSMYVVSSIRSADLLIGRFFISHKPQKSH